MFKVFEPPYEPSYDHGMRRTNRSKENFRHFWPPCSIVFELTTNMVTSTGCNARAEWKKKFLDLPEMKAINIYVRFLAPKYFKHYPTQKQKTLKI
jgi:hypothetical protein